MSQERIVWIDCEMTGLDTVNDALVEVACIVTDGDLNELDPGLQIVIATDQEHLERMDPYVVSMHTESGLLPLIPDGVAVAEAEQAVGDEVLLVDVRGKAGADTTGDELHERRIVHDETVAGGTFARGEPLFPDLFDVECASHARGCASA